MRKAVFVLVVTLVVSLTLFCAHAVNAEVRGVTDKEIKIGTIAPITGPAGSLGVLWIDATRTYVNYINDNGGVNGRRLDLIIEDDRYSIPPALAAFKKIVYRDKVFVMIGPGSASLVNVLWKNIEKEKLPTMSVATPEILFNPFKMHVFSIMDTYSGQTKVLVDYMVKDFNLKEPKVALVYPDTDNGKMELASTVERLSKYNITPVTKEVLAPGAIDAATQVMSIKRYKANVIVHAGSITPTTIVLLKELRKMGLKVPVFGSWSAMLGEEINAIGEAANQFYSVHPTSPWYGKGPGMEKMRKITLKYHPGTEKPYRGTIYTNLWVCNTVLVEGLKRAGKSLNEKALISAIEGIKNYDTGGLCGPISYSAESHKGGDSCQIYRADPASGRYVAITGWRKAE
ncbi:MAG: ABC transporter substrate-binding protein [Desulfobacteria bacterium]